MHLLMPKVSRTPTQNKCLITVMDLILPFYILDWMMKTVFYYS